MVASDQVIDQDRTVWDLAWRAMEHREVPDLSALDIKRLVNTEFGPLESATISEVPIQFVDLLYFSYGGCLLCSMLFADPTQKMPASVNLDFEVVKNLGFSVWVHRKCFKKLTISDEPGPIPW